MIPSFAVEINETLKNNKEIISSIEDGFYFDLFSIYNKQKANIKDNTKLTYEIKSKFILDIANQLQKHGETILCKHSTCFWLQLLRKIDYSIILTTLKQRGTKFLIRDTLDALTIRFGKYQTDDVLRTKNGIVPLFDTNDIWYCVELIVLSKAYYYLTSAYKRVNKGCDLFFEHNYFDVIANGDLDQLMEIVDLRTENHSNIFNLFTSESLIIDGDEQINKPIILSSSYLESDQYNFGAFGINMDIACRAMSFWENMDIEIKGFRPYEILSLFASLTWSRMALSDPGAESTRIQLRNDMKLNGFSLIDKESLLSGLMDVFPMIYFQITGERICQNNEQSEKITNQLVGRFYTEFSKIDTNVFIRSNYPLFIDQDKFTIINWLNSLHSFNEWIDSQNESEKIDLASNRGQIFQTEVRRRLKELSENQNIEIWPTKTEFFYLENIKKQVDVGFIKDNFFFIVECKVKLYNTNYELGTRKQQFELWSLQKKWLRQVDSVASLISKGAKLKNGSGLPTSIDYIVPIVCTTTPMFQFEMKEPYFISTNIPRVIVPGELKELIAKNPIYFNNIIEIVQN